MWRWVSVVLSARETVFLSLVRALYVCVFDIDKGDGWFFYFFLLRFRFRFRFVS